MLTYGSRLADSPSSFIVRITSAGDGREVRATATGAVPVGGGGLVLLEDALPPGRYLVEAVQHSCGMRGGDCPDDPSSAEFVGVPEWRCAASFEVDGREPTTVEVVEGPDPDIVDRRTCRVVE